MAIAVLWHEQDSTVYTMGRPLIVLRVRDKGAL